MMVIFLVAFPFFIWAVSWWGFVSGRLALEGDAFFYYWDSRFFLDNISRGVYPLWNPDYSGGVPWNFFLRRMGEGNPFYWINNVSKYVGASPIQAHLAFLVLYYFLGMAAFWLLARLFLKDRLTSTAAFLLLLFSWGGQLFYCFDVLLFVPLAWFFYFLFAFARQKKKHQFLGACFAAALMATTYIPFFTLTIIGVFSVFFFLFFMKESFVFLKDTLFFLRSHKLFAALSLGFFLLACAPNIDFYLESRQGGFVMPSRHFGSTDPSEVAVNVHNAVGSIAVSRTVWDIIAHGYFDRVFADQQDMGVGDFNIAYPVFIVLVLSLINPISRRTALLLVSAVFITLIAMTKGRVYSFLLEHVFIFRYMRMLQLFFWLAVLPMAVLMAMEQLRVFLKDHYGRKNIKVLAFVVIVHVLFLAGLLTQEGVVWSSYLALVLSLVFFVLSIMGRWEPRALAMILWVSLIIQPITFAWTIERNSSPWREVFVTDHTSFYDGQGNFLLQKGTSAIPAGEDDIKRGDVVHESSAGYYENPWLNNLRQFIFQDNIQRFVTNKLLLFDNTMPEDDYSQEKFFVKLNKMWGALQNLAFFSWDGSSPDDFQSLAPGILKAQVAYEGDSAVKVLSFDANTLRLRTHLDRPRFLLWTNGYHSGWHVYIDGRKGRLLRADYAFRFGTPLRYAAAYVLLLAYAVVLVIVVVLGLREGFLVEKEVAIGR